MTAHGTLQIINPAYVASAVNTSQYPEGDLPEIAFLGRSNVGKSSLINSLCRHRGLARVSGSPGKTQTLNYYGVTLQEKQQNIRRKHLFILSISLAMALPNRR